MEPFFPPFRFGWLWKGRTTAPEWAEDRGKTWLFNAVIQNMEVTSMWRLHARRPSALFLFFKKKRKSTRTRSVTCAWFTRQEENVWPTSFTQRFVHWCSADLEPPASPLQVSSNTQLFFCGLSDNCESGGCVVVSGLFWSACERVLEGD